MNKLGLLAFLSPTFLSSHSFAANVETAPFSKATVVMPISDITINGNTAEFTVTKNARSLKNKADDAKFFALRKTGASASSICAKTNSAAIDKKVKNYNVFTGEARIFVSFQDADTAKQAMEKDCLVVENTSY